VSGEALAGEKKEGGGPQSKADLVWEAVEGVQGGVSNEMIGLRDRCCPPFALFVSILISTLWNNGTLETHRTTNSHESSSSLM